MIDGLPRHINFVFIITALLTLGFIYYALVKHSTGSKSITPLNAIMFLVGWMLLLTILSINSFFLDFEAFPPRFAMVLGPPIAVIVFLFVKRRSRNYIRGLPISTLTYLHVVRVPVEVVLWWLYLENTIPELMTFEGRNFDIMAGISAPFIGYFVLGRVAKSNLAALLWNFLALGLLFNIVINAVLATPYAFQQQAFDQPNVAVFYFPFILLPGFVVPAVLFSHLASILILNSKDPGQ